MTGSGFAGWRGEGWMVWGSGNILIGTVPSPFLFAGGGRLHFPHYWIVLGLWELEKWETGGEYSICHDSYGYQ